MKNSLNLIVSISLIFFGLLQGANKNCLLKKTLQSIKDNKKYSTNANSNELAEYFLKNCWLNAHTDKSVIMAGTYALAQSGTALYNDSDKTEQLRIREALKYNSKFAELKIQKLKKSSNIETLFFAINGLGAGTGFLLAFEQPYAIPIAVFSLYMAIKNQSDHKDISQEKKALEVIINLDDEVNKDSVHPGD